MYIHVFLFFGFYKIQVSYKNFPEKKRFISRFSTKKVINKFSKEYQSY